MYNEQISLFKTEPTEKGEISEADLKTALYKSNGYIYRAAKLLNADYIVLHKFISKNNELKELIKILKERNREEVENILNIRAKEGNIPAIRNYLQFFDMNTSFVRDDNDNEIKIDIRVHETDKH